MLLIGLVAGLAAGCAARVSSGRSTLAILGDGPDPSQVKVVLTGPAVRALEARTDPPARDALFYLAVDRDDGGAPVPMLARLEIGRERAVLRPRVSLTPGLAYTATFEGPRLDPRLPRLTQGYSVPRETAPSPSRVTLLAPAEAALPANLLKFIIYFSEPMAEGHVFRYVSLLDAAGRPVDQAFREVELWAEEHRRLTLWINPGRTKRSLGLGVSLGPVLEPGRRYTLELGNGLPDSRGRRMATGLRHSFRTTPYDRSQPRIDAWELAVPIAGDRSSLRVAFGEPLDFALARRALVVESPGGDPLPGKSAVLDGGRAWAFTPESPWQAGAYALVAGGELEDLAGNSLFRPFESSPEENTRPAAEPPVFRRGFVVRVVSW